MSRKLRNLKIDEVSLVDKGANQEAHITLFKRDATMADDKDAAAKVKALEAQLAEKTQAAEEAQKELAALKESGALSSDLGTKKKQLAEKEKALASARAELEKQLDERTKELEATRTEVTKLQTQARRDTFIKRVSELSSLPGAPADDFAEILDNIESGLRQVISDPAKAEKQFAKFNLMLSSWNEIIKKSAIMNEIGRTGRYPALRGAEAVLVQMAKEREVSKKIPYQQAYAEVLQENPEIYQRYRAEKES